MANVIVPESHAIKEAWRGRHAYIAWGTIALFVMIILSIVSLIYSLEIGALTSLQAIPVSTVLIYLSFTVIHEAGHKNIVQGVKWMQPIERYMGWLCAIPFIIIPFSLFARIHDLHHAHTNDPDRDPDYWVSSNSWIKASLKSLMLPLHYIAIGVSKFKTDPLFKKTKNSAMIYWGCMGVLLTFFIVKGYGELLLIAWVLPVVLASFILAMLFDWIPHRPNIQQSRYQNTRIYMAPFVNAITLGQSYHLIHHLNPRVPWYAYKKVFNQTRQALVKHQAPIEGISNSALPKLFKAPSITKANHNNKPGKFTLTVKSIIKETLDAVSITFDERETEGLHFKAGQYVTLSKVIGREWVTRCYSICSAPSSGQLSIVAKQVPGGVMSRYLNDTLKQGDKLTVAGPFGHFVLNDEDKQEDQMQRLILIAAGSGITPIMSMLQDALGGRSYSSVDLIYCNRSNKHTIFKHEIECLEEANTGYLNVCFVNSKASPSLDSATGRLTPAMLKGLLTGSLNLAHCYICGPETLTEMAKQTLLDMEIPEQSIHHESFTKEVKLPKGQRYKVTIDMADDSRHVLDVAENQTVLEVATQKGIDLPHACGVGQCGCCMLNRIKGSEYYASDDFVAVLEEERKAGKTLACQCQPRSNLHLTILN
jgi:ferredoxin-NADP reductase/fatty acid desaturase